MIHRSRDIRCQSSRFSQINSNLTIDESILPIHDVVRRMDAQETRGQEVYMSQDG